MRLRGRDGTLVSDRTNSLIDWTKLELWIGKGSRCRLPQAQWNFGVSMIPWGELLHFYQ